MSEFHIRLTAAADTVHLPAVERSSAESFLTIDDLAWLATDSVLSVAEHRRFAAAGASWVAIAGAGASAGVPVGFLCAETAGPELHVWELAVHAAWQRRGLGRRLLQAAIDRARSEGLGAVTLTTFREVPWNEPFYRSLGFETLGPAPGERLAALLRRETERGLPRRCAMRLTLI